MFDARLPRRVGADVRAGFSASGYFISSNGRLSDGTQLALPSIQDETKLVPTEGRDEAPKV
jgi:hypothetical protein